MTYHLRLIALMCTLYCSASFGFNCVKKIAEYEACGASFAFGYTYEKICKEGSTLNQSDIQAILKSHEKEIVGNKCLERAYVYPRFDRANQKERYKRKKEIQDSLKYMDYELREKEKKMQQQKNQQKKYRWEHKKRKAAEEAAKKNGK